MAFTRQQPFSKKTTDLPDVPSPTYTATQIKEYIETPSDENKTFVDGFINEIEAETGAGNIGAKKADGSTSTVQDTLDEKAKTTDLSAVSGATKIGATKADGSKSTVQAVLDEKAKNGGDWTGTWQGYTPSKADPGISSVVEQHTAQLAKTLNISRNYLTYKTVSTTVGQNGTDIPTTGVYQHLKNQGADNTLVVMLNITNDTDPNPQMLSDSIVNSAITNANSIGVSIKMLKLHVGVNFSDGYDRSNYNPDPATFFLNWTTICLHYAQLCQNNNIPILCIGCEQKLQTIDDNYSYWSDLVNSLRTSYSNLLLTYAAQIGEVNESNPRKFWDKLDFVGMNLYIDYTNKLASQNPTIDECISSLYDSKNGESIMEIVNIHANKFDKKVFITETGLAPQDSCLAIPYDSTLTNFTKTYDGQSIGMKAVFDGLCQNKNIIGIAWWHVKEPFDYFVDGSTTSAEQTMIDYMKGGLI